jgi:hypothetical protein
MGANSRLKACRLRSNNFKELNTLYNLVFNKHRTLEQFSWEFRDGPYGGAYQWIGHDENDRVIAHWGVLPNYLAIGGKIVKAGKQENAMIAPEYRGKGLYSGFQRKSVEKAWREGYSLPWCTLSAAAYVHVKAGFKPVGEISNLVCKANPSLAGFLGKFFLVSINNAAQWNLNNTRRLLRTVITILRRYKTNVQEGNREFKIRIEDFDEAKFNSFLRKWYSERGDNFNNKSNITIARDYPYIEWRFIKNPHVNHRLNMILSDRDGVSGYLVWHRVLETVYIDDLLLLDQYFVPDCLRMLFSCLRADIDFQKALIVDFLTLRDSPMFDLLLSAGFCPLSERSSDLRKYLLVCPSEDLGSDIINFILKPSNWYVTRIFTEGLF